MANRFVRLFMGLGCIAFLAGVGTLQAQRQESVSIVEGVTIQLPDGWKVAERLRGSVELVRAGREKGVTDARMLVTVETRLDHADALRRLLEISNERREPGRLSVVGGWPAFERRYVAPLPVTGEEQPKPYAPERETTWVTLAIAADAWLIRLETTSNPDAPPGVDDEVQRVGREVQLAKKGRDETAKREIEQLRRSIAATQASPSPAGVPPGEGKQEPEATKPHRPGAKPGVPTNARAGVGELEVTASANGQNVLIATNTGSVFSTNGGVTFNAGVAGTPGGFPADGDPSLALGATGNMYWSFIGFPDGSVAAGGVTGCSDSVAVSANNGQTFAFRSHAVLCPNTGSICFPDQEHVAADRFTTTAGGNDQVYLVWRNFTPAGPATSCLLGSGFAASRITCSSDSGTTWTATASIGAGDFPRVTVGSDGFVYVAYTNGGNISLNKFSSCTAGLVQQVGFPVTVSAFSSVVCPVAGLDRCNSGNTLASPVAAVDDLDPNHVYVTFATNTAANNENVVVADSMDGGLTFPRSVTVNAAGAGRRFMPWVSTYGGVAYVAWYDRSMAAATNDQTRYFGNTASVRAGNLVAGTQVDISQVTDAQCSTWPCRPRATTDSEACTTQPQLAGRCRNAGGGGSNTACDFSAGGCPAGESCVTGGGCPKYGDYNGNAAIGGRWFAAWASAVAPPGVTAPGAGINVYADSILTANDFFVRDWTTSATSHDMGPEPSTHAVFYHSSDVWSQQTSTPNAPVADWVAGDLARKGTGVAGDNWAFTRVSRRAAAATTAASVDVTATFYAADFGLGTTFAAVGTPQTLTFAAADLTKTLTPGVPWHVVAGASIHVCLAVEIAAPGDPLQAPSIAGNAPGPADPFIVIDNNKAQRNIDTVVGTGASGLSGFALIRNAERETRFVDLVYEIPDNLCDRLRGVRVAVGGRWVDLACSGTLSVGRLRPGEVRWLETSFPAFHLKPGELLPVSITEMGRQAPANGFVIAARGEDLRGMLAENANEHARTFSRVVKGHRLPAADKLVGPFKELSLRKEVGEEEYRKALTRSRAAVAEATKVVAKAVRADELGLEAKLREFDRAARGKGSIEELAVAHSRLIRAIDAALTGMKYKPGSSPITP